MTVLGVGIFVLMVLALFVKQSAFILLFGSVFESLRNTIHYKMMTAEWKAGEWFWTKANELFTCNLCMTAQVAIWTAALPSTVAIHFLWRHPFEGWFKLNLHVAVEVALFLAVWFVLSMAIASVAMAIWTAFEFSGKKLEQESKFFADLLKLQSDQNLNLQELLVKAASGENKNNKDKKIVDGLFGDLLKILEGSNPDLGSGRMNDFSDPYNDYDSLGDDDDFRMPLALRPSTGTEHHMEMSHEDFIGILDNIDSKCQGIGCGIARRKCRKEQLESALKFWTRNNGNAAHYQKMLAAMSQVLPGYFKYRFMHKKDLKAMERYKQETFNKMVK